MKIDNPHIVDILVRLRQCVDNPQVFRVEQGEMVISVNVCVVSTRDVTTLLEFIEEEE